ncbi:MAG: hypothetical protein QOG13_653 [Sphingomonadales bacterium]|jgi:hypothetical protein|nr:hypothetical protein [Sphingomonadales bacterium]
MIQLAPIASMLLVMVAAGQSGGALVAQRLDGLRRICGYEDLARGRRAPPLQIAIGMAEPCPFQYPGRRAPPPQQVPSMATLEGESRVDGRKICRYIYLGVRYSRAVQPGQTCPLTPHFNE